MTITVVTPTGDRSLAFALCQLWISRQIRRPDQWIVVDDGRTPVVPFFPMDYVRREPERGDPKITLSLNLQTAFPKIREDADVVFIMEDDDYYSPEYISEMIARMDGKEVVGIGRARYYHLPGGLYFRHENIGHASLGETAFRRSVFPEYQKALLQRMEFVDMAFWPLVASRGLVFSDDDTRPLHCSLKSMPGRKGVSHGHDQNYPYYRGGSTLETRNADRRRHQNRPMIIRHGGHDDANRSVLRQWTGADAELYLAIARGMINESGIRAIYEKEQTNES